MKTETREEFASHTLCATVISNGAFPYNPNISGAIRTAYSRYREVSPICGKDEVDMTPAQKGFCTLRFNKLVKVIESEGRDVVSTLSHLSNEAPKPEETNTHMGEES